MKRKLKKELLKQSIDIYDLKKAKEGLEFVKGKNVHIQSQKTYIVSFIIMIIAVVSFSILILYYGGDDSMDDIGNSAFIPGTAFTHIKVTSIDERDVYYVYNRYSQYKNPQHIPYKILNVEILEIFNFDNVSFSSNNRNLDVGNYFLLAIPLEMYEYYQTYNEFIINPLLFRADFLHLSDTNEFLFYNYEPFMAVYQYVDYEGWDFHHSNITPVEHNKIRLPNPLHLDHGINMLAEGNFKINDPNYMYRDGMTIDELRIYFEIHKNIPYN